MIQPASNPILTKLVAAYKDLIGSTSDMVTPDKIDLDVLAILTQVAQLSMIPSWQSVFNCLIGNSQSYYIDLYAPELDGRSLETDYLEWNGSLSHPTILPDSCLAKVVELYQHNQVYPLAQDLLRVYQLAPEQVKVVILGQDPYHNGHADGLAFSSRDVKTPASLRNIFKLIKMEYGDAHQLSVDGNDLTNWHEQGVFLLNTRLTVLKHIPLHPSCDIWEDLIITTLQVLAKQPNVVFVLWGRHAQKYKRYLHDQCHIIESSHPSPLSARVDFFSSQCFTRINKALIEAGKEPICW